MTRPAVPEQGRAQDPFAADSGAYVLGSLTGPERIAFEEHLSRCTDCRREVSELADLPGLLGQVPADLVGAMAGDLGLGAQDVGQATHGTAAGVVPPRDDAVVPPLDADAPHDTAPPPLLLADLLRRARQERAARHRRRIVGAFAAAAVLVGALAVSTGSQPLPWRSSAPGPTVAAEAIELAAVVPSPITASVRLFPASWGTRIDLECGYARAPGTPSGDYGQAGRDYVLVVRSSAGAEEQVATWSAAPGEEVSLPGATSIARDQIVEVELRADDGTVLLRADT